MHIFFHVLTPIQTNARSVHMHGVCVLYIDFNINYVQYIDSAMK